MRRGETIAVSFTPIGEQAMRALSESDTSMERGTSLLTGLGLATSIL